MENREGKEYVVFRTHPETECSVLTNGILSADEWNTESSINRIFQNDWQYRYEYESDIISQIVHQYGVSNILELGPGPGVLCSKLSKKCEIKEYHLVDIEAASVTNKSENFGGTFHIRDLNEGLNLSLDSKMDLIIANDFLEHIQNPAKIVLESKSLLKSDGLMFISVPNWRMGHAWIYRGLFDWDNFIHFMWQHGFKMEGYSESGLKCTKSKKLDSESSMPDDLIDSWNFYILFKRNDNVIGK